MDDNALRDAATVLAERFWSIHPNELDALGYTPNKYKNGRAAFYTDGIMGLTQAAYAEGLTKAWGLLHVHASYARDQINHADATLGQKMLNWIQAIRQDIMREKLRAENPTMGLEDLTNTVQETLAENPIPADPKVERLTRLLVEAEASAASVSDNYMLGYLSEIREAISELRADHKL